MRPAASMYGARGADWQASGTHDASVQDLRDQASRDGTRRTATGAGVPRPNGRARSARSVPHPRQRPSLSLDRNGAISMPDTALHSDSS